MIYTSSSGRIHLGYLRCDVCQNAKSEVINFWSRGAPWAPLCFAVPTGWLAIRLKGSLWGHACPSCAAQRPISPPTNQPPNQPLP